MASVEPTSVGKSARTSRRKRKRLRVLQAAAAASWSALSAVPVDGHDDASIGSGADDIDSHTARSSSRDSLGDVHDGAEMDLDGSSHHEASQEEDDTRSADQASFSSAALLSSHSGSEFDEQQGGPDVAAADPDPDALMGMFIDIDAPPADAKVEAVDEEPMTHDSASEAVDQHVQLFVLQLLLSRIDHNAPMSQTEDILTIVRASLGPLLPPAAAAALPSTVAKAMQLAAPMLTELKVIDCCPGDCLLYRGQFADDFKCPKCQQPRLTSCGRPRRCLYTFPIIPRLKALFLCPEFISAVTHSRRRDASPPGCIRDVYDAAGWAWMREQSPDPLTLAFSLSTDGLNSSDRGGLSIWPIVLGNLSAPGFLRHRPSFLHICAIAPTVTLPARKSDGEVTRSSPSKAMVEMCMQPIIDELVELYTGVAMAVTVSGLVRSNLADHYGVPADMRFHAGQTTQITIRAFLLSLTSDYRAASIMTSLRQHPAKHPCPSCVIAGTARHGTTIFCGYHRYLDIPAERDANPAYISPFHRTARAPPLRTCDEHAQQALASSASHHPVDSKLHPSAKTGVIKQDSFSIRLPYFNITRSYIYDYGHAAMNTAKDIWGLITGKSKQLSGVKRELERDATGLDRDPSDYLLSPAEKVRIEAEVRALRLPTTFGRKLRSPLSPGFMKMYDSILILSSIGLCLLRTGLHPNVYKTIAMLVRMVELAVSHLHDEDSLLRLDLHVKRTLWAVEQHLPSTLLTVVLHLWLHCARAIRWIGPLKGSWGYGFERLIGRCSKMLWSSINIEVSLSRELRYADLADRVRLGLVPARYRLPLSLSMAESVLTNPALFPLYDASAAMVQFIGHRAQKTLSAHDHNLLTSWCASNHGQYQQVCNRYQLAVAETKDAPPMAVWEPAVPVLDSVSGADLSSLRIGPSKNVSAVRRVSLNGVIVRTAAAAIAESVPKNLTANAVVEVAWVRPDGKTTTDFGILESIFQVKLFPTLLDEEIKEFAIVRWFQRVELSAAEQDLLLPPKVRLQTVAAHKRTVVNLGSIVPHNVVLMPAGRPARCFFAIALSKVDLRVLSKFRSVPGYPDPA